MRRHAEWGPDGERKFAPESYIQQVYAWQRRAAKTGVRERVFGPSVADPFEGPHGPNGEGRNGPRPDYLSVIERMFRLAAGCPDLDFQVLTKRPWNAVAWWKSTVGGTRWPPNLWIGTSVEDQRAADERIPWLTQLPARVLFLSCEPLLERVDLSRWIGYTPVHATQESREQGLRGSVGRMAGDPIRRLGMEDRAEAGQSVERCDDGDAGPPSQDRLAGRGGLQDGQGDGGWHAVMRAGASSRMASLSRADSSGPDDQPHQRGQVGQSAREPGVSDLRRAGAACDKGSQGRTRLGSGGGKELHGDAEPGGRSGDPSAPESGGVPGGAGYSIRHVAGERVGNRAGETVEISWVIIGGESGRNARVMRMAWADDIVAQCKAAGVPVFVKQMGTVTASLCGYLDKKGGDPAEWPTFLRVQEFPDV